MPKLDYSKTHHVIFTATKTLADELPIAPLENTENPVQIKISKDNSIYLSVNVDLKNPLSLLKYKVFLHSGIHPINQIIKFAGNALTNEAELLADCGVKAEGILELHFKTISNIIPASYSDKFFYKDVQTLHAQDSQAYSQFKSHLLAFGFHLEETDKPKILSFLRHYTANEPLVAALRALFYSAFFSQSHRVAI